MNFQKAILRALGHAALGGIATGIGMIPAGVPLTKSTVLFPILASALTSVISLFSQSPKQ